MGTDELVKVELPDETPTTWPALVECVTTTANDSVQGDNDLEEDESIPCYTCKMLLNGPQQYIEHIQSKRHMKQVQAASREADHRRSVEDSSRFADQQVHMFPGEADCIKAMTQFNVQKCCSVISNWLAKMAAMLQEQKSQVVRASQNAQVKEALALVRTESEKIDAKTATEMCDALASEGVLDLLAMMQGLRALDKRASADNSGIGHLQEHYPFLSTVDLQGFIEDIKTKIHEDDTDLKQCGMIMADLTVSQSMVRELQPGETRHDLIRKISNGLQKRKWHKQLTPSVQRRVEVALG